MRITCVDSELKKQRLDAEMPIRMDSHGIYSHRLQAPNAKINIGTGCAPPVTQSLHPNPETKSRCAVKGGALGALWGFFRASTAHYSSAKTPAMARSHATPETVGSAPCKGPVAGSRCSVRSPSHPCFRSSDHKAM